MGDHNREDGGEEGESAVRVCGMTLHPEFKPEDKSFKQVKQVKSSKDIAILHLCEALHFTDCKFYIL